MLKEILHIGITVSDINKSINFYQNILGLEFKGELLMEGEETELLFGRKNSRARIVYFNGSKELIAPPIELIYFLDKNVEKIENSLFKTSISEICFRVENIDEVYKKLLEKNIEFLSEPQYYDFSKYGFGKSKVVYFKDPDGIILELIENIKD